jgi:hypothetical protein
LNFEDFQWDLEIERHVRARGLRLAIVHTVLTGTPKAYPNRVGRRGSQFVIGPVRRGRFWTLILLQARNGRWRPITGWPSKASEIQQYRETE